MNSAENSDFHSVVVTAVQTSVGVTFGSILGESPDAQTTEVQFDPSSRVASVISFFGARPWAMTLIVPETTAVALARKFTGFDVAFDTPDMADVVGELTNVLAGEVVAQLSRRGVESQMSLPTIARGNDVELLSGRESDTRQLVYASPQGRFWFEICTASNVRKLCRTPGTAA